jgi:hypothetical protein
MFNFQGPEERSKTTSSKVDKRGPRGTTRWCRLCLPRSNLSGIEDVHIRSSLGLCVEAGLVDDPAVHILHQLPLVIQALLLPLLPCYVLLCLQDVSPFESLIELTKIVVTAEDEGESDMKSDQQRRSRRRCHDLDGVAALLTSSRPCS